MLEILVVMAVLAIMMAKRNPRKRRSMGRYIRGKIEIDGALGALATKDLIAVPTSETTSERMWLSSVVATWSLKDLASVVDDGPIIVGLAHGDYSAAEIEEFLENTGSWAEGSLQAQEVAKRKIRIVGTFQQQQGDVVATQVLNDGKEIRTKCNWILTTGKAIDFWAYNAGADAITTGSNLHVYGHANLWPR